MKKIILPFLIALAVLPAFGQNFVAVKGGNRFQYTAGVPLRVTVLTDKAKRAKGHYAGADAGGVYLQPFRIKDTNRIYVPLSQIQSVTCLHRKGRKALDYINAAGAAVSGALLVATDFPFDSPMGYVVFIPAAIGAVAALYAVPVTYIGEWMGKKSRQRGWEFTVE